MLHLHLFVIIRMKQPVVVIIYVVGITLLFVSSGLHVVDRERPAERSLLFYRKFTKYTGKLLPGKNNSVNMQCY